MASSVVRHMVGAERAEEEILMSQQWKWFSNFCLYYVAGMSHMALPRFWEVEFSGPEGK